MENSTIYQINTRTFCFQQKKKLIDIPISFFEDLKKKGVKYVWFMGVWQPLSQEYIDKFCKEDFLIKEYQHAVPDVAPDDIIGSPYAISSYKLNKSLGKIGDIKALKEKLNSIGLKLILDFVPNHFGASSELLSTHPDVFLEVSRERASTCPVTFFEADNNKGRFFAHGKDPNFPAWQDTVQVNYFSDSARSFMERMLLHIAKIADGVRCDMAMLPVTRVFKRTWQDIVSEQNLQEPQKEFWNEAISKVKAKHPDFIFLAEVYWDMEWELQNLGFDYTYDKTLLDRLEHETAGSIKLHLKAEELYQRKSIRFIENHDEERSITSLGVEKAKMSAIIISTILGMRFYFDGQFEGRRVRTPVQLRRDRKEDINQDMKNFYERLLKITNNEIFKKGNWTLIETQKGQDELSFNNILSWIWEYQGEKRLVVINYSEYESSCHIRIDFSSKGNDASKVVFNDLLNDVSYERRKEDLDTYGLYISLKPYNAHIFSF